MIKTHNQITKTGTIYKYIKENIKTKKLIQNINKKRNTILKL